MKTLNHKKMRKYVGKYYSQTSKRSDRRFLKEDNIIESRSPFGLREEFTRDKDRIIHTKAFRRLQHKAQVYSNEDGDHYRTRLTHTLEVAQIAKAIARNLNVNEDLTEAIALGHDIGHTPFGHAGEKVIEEILRGDDDLGGKLKYCLNYGGFKHNFNSLKILELVEHKYPDSDGLNLTWQVLDGICKHTKIEKYDTGKIWDWTRFVGNSDYFKEIIGYSYPNFIPYNDNLEIGIPLTIEGQIVQLADEIAQREHDLDDGFRGENGNKFVKLQSIINHASNSITPDMGRYGAFINLKDELNLDVTVKDIQNKKLTDDDKLDLKWIACIRNIVSYFIMDVSENSLIKIYDSDKEKSILKVNSGERKYIVEKLVDFSECASILHNSMELFIENRIINSYEVNCFDGKGEYILSKLFKAYYKNPKQMPQSQLRILEKMIRKNSKKYGKLMINGKESSSIKFIPSSFEDEINYEDVEKLISALKLESDDFNNVIISENISFVNYSDDEKCDYLNSKINDDDCEIKLKHYLENHYAYLYVISNYISKMTDNYAEKQYSKLYLKM